MFSAVTSTKRLSNSAFRSLLNGCWSSTPPGLRSTRPGAYSTSRRSAQKQRCR
jgi:hypothetical protein